MVERLKATVLKTVGGKPSGSSNLPSSAICLLRLLVRISGFHPEEMGSIPIGDAIFTRKYKKYGTAKFANYKRAANAPSGGLLWMM